MRKGCNKNKIDRKETKINERVKQKSSSPFFFSITGGALYFIYELL